METIERLGIMGGTFDPIHYGHLVTAEAARCSFSLDQVVFVPSGRPPHKQGKNTTDAQYRSIMTQMAIVTNPAFRYSDVELRREGLSYAVDTVRYFRDLYGAQVKLYFITGADAILQIASWEKISELMNLCVFIAATRPGYDLSGLSHLPQEWRSRIMPFEVPALAISSTDIRQRVAQGKSIKYLLPETVENYIIKQELYREKL